MEKEIDREKIDRDRECLSLYRCVWKCTFDEKWETEWEKHESEKRWSGEKNGV